MKFDQQVLIDGDGGEVFPFLRKISLGGTNFEIGKQLAEINIANHGDTLDKHLVPDPAYGRARREYFQQHYPIYWERMRGVAAALGADELDDRFDFSAMYHNVDLPPRPGCSNAFYPPNRTATGHTYLSRNYEFSTGTFADVVGIELDAETRSQMKAMMGEPYIMEWNPTDGGYASWAMHVIDVLGGAFDGINSAGLAVALMADEEAMGSLYEPHQGFVRAVGVGELQIVRLLLDTCATVDEAKHTLLSIKQYYEYVPCHYIIADASGRSFVYENSTGRNQSIIVDGGGEPQVCTNHQIYHHEINGVPELTLETNSQWRFATLQDQVQAVEQHSVADMRDNSASVGVKHLVKEMLKNPNFASVAANANSRTLWYSLFDLTERTVEIDFYLNSRVTAAGQYEEDRSQTFQFTVPAVEAAPAPIQS